MIPQTWIDERIELHRRLREQEAEFHDTVTAVFTHVAASDVEQLADILGSPEVADLRTAGEMTKAELEALAEKPATAADLAELATIGRGHYRDGDTRGFVESEEDKCTRYNCWMRRSEDGTPSYHSENV